jgi:hypothetical protein
MAGGWSGWGPSEIPTAGSEWSTVAIVYRGCFARSGISLGILTAFLIGAAPASAATTLGHTAAAPPSGGNGNINCVQATTDAATTPKYTPGAGQGGVITSWSHRGGAGGPQIRLVIYQQIDADTFKPVRASALKNTVVGTNNYPETPGIRIQPGEILGLWMTNPSNYCFGSGLAGDVVRAKDPGNDPASALNTNQDFNAPICCRLNVAATVEPDADGDGFGDETQDQCPSDASTQGTCPPAGDADSDGIPNGSDNCPNAANPNQENFDGDAQGDVCDVDDDNDGVADASDNCQFVVNGDQANADGDGQGNACDEDDDNDGVPDAQDPFPLDPTNGGLEGLPTSGPDLLNGTANVDTICGLGGDDVIDGLQGNDTIFGDQCDNARRSDRALDDGNDTLNGSEGDDALFGSGGNDILNGDEGNDALTGGPGNDKLNGDAGKNSYLGEDGNDKINSANKVKGERINCGAGKKDKATVDKGDKPKKNCEKVKRK